MFTLRKNLAQTIFRLEQEAIVASRRCSNVADRDNLRCIADVLNTSYFQTCDFHEPKVIAYFAQDQFNLFIAATAVAKAHDFGCDSLDVVTRFRDFEPRYFNFLDVEFNRDVVKYIIADCAFPKFQAAEIKAGDRVLYRFEDSDDYWYNEAYTYGTVNVPLLTEGRRQLRAELYRLDRELKLKEARIA